MDIPLVLVLAFLAGASTLVGGIISIMYDTDKRGLHFVLTASSGIVFSVVMLGVLQLSLKLGTILYTALGFILGGVAMIVAVSVFPHTYGAERYGDRLYSLLKTESLVVSGIITHNLPAGLLIGSCFAISQPIGLVLLAAVFLQNIPRGMAINAPLLRINLIRPRILLIMLLAGIPAMVGALLAFASLAGLIPIFQASGMAFAAGAFFFVCIDQLVPLVKSYSRMHETAAALFIGIFFGVLLLGIG